MKETGLNIVNYIKGKAKGFFIEEDGMGVVEVVLIIIVLVGLVILFKNQITGIVNGLLSKMSSQINQI